ncbi:MAG TPA: S8 family serine peptidase [Candidatus Nitrosotalea sp.]|nr:S8 family serine peptidase [Candidatus Nitrosotalea sp.]
MQKLLLGLVICASLLIVFTSVIPLQHSFAQNVTQNTVQNYNNTNSKVMFKALMDKANKEGKVRVIIKLNLPFTIEGKMKNIQSIANQRQWINQTQNLLVGKLSLNKIDHVKRFGTIPFIAMRVDAASLKMLNSSLLVSGIYEDRLLKPLDVNTIPLTGTENAWNLGDTGSGQTIAVLDTGVDKTHPFLSGKVVAEACFSAPAQAGDASFCPNGQTSEIGSGSAVPCPDSISGCFHGTFVAGIAAGNDPTILPGFAKGANIIAVQVFHEDNAVADCGSTTPCIVASDSDIISGLEYVYGLRNSFSIAAANLSLGSFLFTSNCDSTFPQYKSEFDTLQSVGIAPVVASGNDGAVNALDSPACISSAISVGSTSDSDHVSSFSDRASFLSIMAPGESVTSSVPGGGTEVGSGTSFATPAVSGAIAILKQKSPTASVSTILSDLRTTGRSVFDSGNGLSFPRMEVDSAVQFFSCSPPASGDWTISSSCTISSSVTAPANVIVQSGAVLTIPNGLRLNIDFTHYHLLVRSGGGVLIKAGGAIN